MWRTVAASGSVSASSAALTVTVCASPQSETAKVSEGGATLTLALPPATLATATVTAPVGRVASATV